MDKIAHIVGGKVGDAVEGAIKHTLGIKDKDNNKKGGGGGGLSLFGGNKNKDQGKKDEGKGGFFSNLLKKGDDNKGEGKASGFTGLFSEPGGAGAAGESDGGVCEYNPSEENEGQSGGTGGDLYDDLLSVATEISTGQ